MKKIKKDKEFQALVAEGAKTLKVHSFGSTGGCPQCRHAKFGSTCCNPDKIEAKRRAEELWAKKKGLEKVESGKYDHADYTAMLKQVYEELASQRWEKVHGSTVSTEEFVVLASSITTTVVKTVTPVVS